MFDLVIKNGTLVIPEIGLKNWDICIADGKISALTVPGSEIKGKKVIDASGKYVFPGAIEPHSHLGIGAGEEDLTTETKSALLGGVTTTLFFLRQPEPYDQVFWQVRESGERKCYTDFGFHLVLLTDEHLQSLKKFIEGWGINSFKLYMTYKGDDAKTTKFGGQPVNCPTIDEGFILEALQRIAAFPEAMAIVHCENMEIINKAKSKLISQGRDDMEAWALSRPPVAEAAAVNSIAFLAKYSGARVNILHLTSRHALHTYQEARRTNQRITAESCHPYLALTHAEDLGVEAKLRPPLRSTEDVEALWQAIADGSIQTVGSDHVPRKLHEKMGSVWKLAAGAAGTPYLLPIMLTEGYHKRGISLQRISQVTAYNIAQLYGLSPQKGDIQIGCDADLVIVDLDKEGTLKLVEGYSDYSLYEGRKVKGVPETTILKGQIMVENGQIKDVEPIGKYLVRS